MKNRIVVFGKENVGKSQLIASLTGRSIYSSNLPGTTLDCRVYESEAGSFVDTPGIIRQSDSVLVRETLQQLGENDTVLLVAQATHLDDDLDELIPLARGKRGAVAITFWDKVNPTPEANETVRRLSLKSRMPFVTVDARYLTADNRTHLLESLHQPQPFPEDRLAERAGWRIEPKPTMLEHRLLGPVLALLLLLLPAWAAVWSANSFAELIDPFIQEWVKPLADRFADWPTLLRETLAGRYGLITMGPLLFVWAVPTIVLYAFFLAAYKASGLLDRLTVALHPLTRPLGLSGRDLVRVLMGFGCNVPAVISTRTCSSCSRQSCIAAIAFGSACSYQFGATLAVFAAVGKPWLVVPYLAYLVATTLIYTRMTATREARSPLNLLMIENRNFLQRPRWSAIWSEAAGTLRQFFVQALPIFFTIAAIASLLDWLCVLTILAGWFAPAMSVFRLPGESALPILLASIRKDGILLFAEPGKGDSLSSLQVLTAVYLAGVLLPCLVTAWTIAREESIRFAVKLVTRQAIAAVLFALLLAWTGGLFF